MSACSRAWAGRSDVRRTERIRLSTDIALLPLYHPIRLAEELAVLDQISNGRMEFGIGMGYVPEEFRAFGVPLKNRVSMTSRVAIDSPAAGDVVNQRGTRARSDRP